MIQELFSQDSKINRRFFNFDNDNSNFRRFEFLVNINSSKFKNFLTKNRNFKNKIQLLPNPPFLHFTFLNNLPFNPKILFFF